MDREQRDVQAGSSGHSAGPTEGFVRELTAHQSRLKGLIRCLLFDPKDVEDVWQDTNVLLIKKAAEFRPGTDFWAWSSAVARYQVLTHCKKQKRSRLLFSTDTLETLAADFDLVRDQVDPRRDALQSCLAQLPLPQRQLLELRYGCLRLSRSMTRRLPLTPAGSCGGCPPRPARRDGPPQAPPASFVRLAGRGSGRSRSREPTGRSKSMANSTSGRASRRFVPPGRPTARGPTGSKAGCSTIPRPSTSPPVSVIPTRYATRSTPPSGSRPSGTAALCSSFCRSTEPWAGQPRANRLPISTAATSSRRWPRR